MVTVILWDTFEMMLLPLPIRRHLRFVMLFLRGTWRAWRSIARSVLSLRPPGTVSRNLWAFVAGTTDRDMGRPADCRLRTDSPRFVAIGPAAELVLQRNHLLHGWLWRHGATLVGDEGGSRHRSGMWTGIPGASDRLSSSTVSTVRPA